MRNRDIVERNLAAQREWYGEPLGDRVRRLMVAFDVSQAHMAEVLGLSPPMLSQLMSGHRAKIGNPVVLARMVLLERQELTPEVASGDRETIRAVLQRVRHSRPTVGYDTLSIDPWPQGPGESVTGGQSATGSEETETLLPALRALAEPAELAAAAGRLQDAFPRLADLLRRAAQSP